MERSRLRDLQRVVDAVRPHRAVVALPERRGMAPMRAVLEVYVSHGVVIEDITVFYERFTGKRRPSTST